MKTFYALRNYNITAETEARYLPKDLSTPHSVSIHQAMRFRTKLAAQRFLVYNTEFKTFRPEMVLA